MKLPSNNLEAFYILAQEKNFSKGAKSLGITQSAFSQRVMNLERELESTLVIREKRSIRLTEEGEKLLRHCERLSLMESDLLSSMTSGDSSELVGHLRISGFSSILRSLLIPSLSKLMQDNTKLKLTLLSRELSELLSDLQSSNVDFILSNKDYKREEIESIFLGIEDNVLVESKNYPKVETYLDHDKTDVTTSSYFKIIKKDHTKINKRYLDDVYGLIDGVKSGFGKAILPKHLIKNEKDLKVINPKVKLSVSVYLNYYKQPYYTSLQKEVIKTVIKYFKSHLRQS